MDNETRKMFLETIEAINLMSKIQVQQKDAIMDLHKSILALAKEVNALIDYFKAIKDKH